MIKQENIFSLYNWRSEFGPLINFFGPIRKMQILDSALGPRSYRVAKLIFVTKSLSKIISSLGF